MASRYALREAEGAIGYDCRRLEDGRRALFRHTAVHRRARRDVLERRDLSAVLGATYVAAAARAANPRLDVDRASDAVADVRESFVRAAFPYLRQEPRRPRGYDDYGEYFDELDAIESAGAGGAGGEAK